MSLSACLSVCLFVCQLFYRKRKNFENPLRIDKVIDKVSVLLFGTQCRPLPYQYGSGKPSFLCSSFFTVHAVATGCIVFVAVLCIFL